MRHCGAVGQLAAHSAFVQGAEKVAIIDSIPYRLEYAKKWLPNLHTINFSKVQVYRVPGKLTIPRVLQNCLSLTRQPAQYLHMVACLRAVLSQGR